MVESSPAHSGLIGFFGMEEFSVQKLGVLWGASYENLVPELLECSKTLSAYTTKIPAGAEYTRKYSVNPTSKRRVEAISQRLGRLAERIIRLNGSHLTPNGDLHDRINDVVECVDLILRRVHRISKFAQSASAMMVRKRGIHDGVVGTDLYSQLQKLRRIEAPISAPLKHASPPQPTEAIDFGPNFTFSFCPKILNKPHGLTDFDFVATRSLAQENKRLWAKAIGLQSIVQVPPSTDAKLLKRLTSMVGGPPKGLIPVPNPYENEIKAVIDLQNGSEDRWGYEVKVVDILYKPNVPNPPQPLKDSPNVVIVRDAPALEQFISDIFSRNSRVVAVDVEHHSEWSYRGITCLIQLSDAEQDYIVDPLQFAGDITILNQILCCPTIVKVLHGSRYDVVWLQKKCGLYLVNTFDTFFASKVLATPGGHSLSNLVDVYCKVQLDKAERLCDWRTRPLNPQRIKYARSDTHYLIFVFECMRNQILTRTNENA